MKEKNRYYFVDEAGDLTLFNRKGKILLGQEGCSKYFMLGVALIQNPHEARMEISNLREKILSDPYLENIPSVHKKTNLSFHAKDDCPEVRRDVYSLINSLDVKVYCIVRRKLSILQTVQDMNRSDKTWRYNQNKIYDSCAKQIFKDRLHLAKENHITFARRGITIETKF